MSDFILPFDVWPQQIVQASVPANRNALRSEILGSRVISDSVTAQPSIPTDGDVYIIPAGATGSAWSTYDVDDLALFREGTWYAFAPVPGIRLVVGSSEKIYDGSAGWMPFGSGGGSAAWGGITGTLSDQTDLQAALDAKLDSVSWGDIEGTLADQTDLQAALDGKLESVSWGDIEGTLSDQADLQLALDNLDAKAKPGQIGITFDAGAGDLAVASFGDFIVPWDATITGWTILCPETVTAQIDVLVDSLANFPPNIGDSITGGNPPSITGTQTEQDTTLTGWSTGLVSGTVVRFVLSSVSAVSRLTLILTVEKT